jgi:hypothetical protein
MVAEQNIEVKNSNDASLVKTNQNNFGGEGTSSQDPEQKNFTIYGVKRFKIQADNKWQNLKIYNPSIEDQAGTEFVSCQVRFSSIVS